MVCIGLVLDLYNYVLKMIELIQIHMKQMDDKVLLMLKHQFMIDQQIMDRLKADKCITFLRTPNSGYLFFDFEREAILINSIEVTIIDDRDKIQSFETLFGQSNSTHPLIEHILNLIKENEKSKIKEEKRLEQIKNGKIARVHRVDIDIDDIDDNDEKEDLTLKQLPEDVRKHLRKGDIIDTEGYRGIGLHYYDGTKLIATIGEYGYFLPEEAFKMVEKHGIDFFGESYCGAEYIMIPDEYEVYNKTEKITHASRAMSLGNVTFEDNDYVVVNDVTYLDTSYTDLY